MNHNQLSTLINRFTHAKLFTQDLVHAELTWSQGGSLFPLPLLWHSPPSPYHPDKPQFLHHVRTGSPVTEATISLSLNAPPFIQLLRPPKYLCLSILMAPCFGLSSRLSILTYFLANLFSSFQLQLPYIVLPDKFPVAQETLNLLCTEFWDANWFPTKKPYFQ